MYIFADLDFVKAKPRIAGGGAYRGNLPSLMQDDNGAYAINNQGQLFLPGNTIAANKQVYYAGANSKSLQQYVEVRCTSSYADGFHVCIGLDTATGKCLVVRLQGLPINVLSGVWDGSTYTAYDFEEVTGAFSAADLVLRIWRTSNTVTHVSTIKVVVYDKTDLTTPLNTMSHTYSEPAQLQTAGFVGLMTPTWYSYVSRLKIGIIASATAFEAGWLSAEIRTTGLAKFACTEPTNGTGTVTYKLHRSTTAGFTPTSGNLIDTQTVPYLSDTTAGPGLYFYKCVQSTVANGSVTSNELVVEIESLPMGLLVIADSYWAEVDSDAARGFLPGWTLADRVRQQLQAFTGRRWIVSNQAVSGTHTDNWIDTYLAPAIVAGDAAFDAAGVSSTNRYAVIDLGRNFPPAPAAFKTAMQTISGTLIAAGYKCIINTSIPIAGNDAGNVYFAGYQEKIDELVNWTTIFSGPRTLYQRMAQEGLRGDNLHPDKEGMTIQATLNSAAIASAAGETIAEGFGALTAAQQAQLDNIEKLVQS